MKTKQKPYKVTTDTVRVNGQVITYPVVTEVVGQDDTELKNLLKAIYEAGAIGSYRNLSDDVAAVRRLV